MRSIDLLAIVLGAVLVPPGAWLLTRDRLPAWMKGIWIWPLGTNLSRGVIHSQGRSLVLIGASSFAASTLDRFSYHSVEAWSAAALTVLLLVSGLALYVRSLLLSRDKHA